MRTVIGVNDPQAVKKWSTALGVAVNKASYFAKKMMGMGKDSRLPIQRMDDLESDAGDEVAYDLLMPMNMEPVVGDETLDGKEQPLKYYTDKLRIDQVRGGADLGSRMTRKRTLRNIRTDAKRVMTDWWKRLYDELFFIYLSGARGTQTGYIWPVNSAFFAVNPITAPDSAHMMYGGVATSKASMVNTDAFDLRLIDRAVAKAETMGGDGTDEISMLPLEIDGEERYVALMHTFQFDAMKSNTATGQWLDIQKAAAAAQGAKNPIFTGAEGMYADTILHKHRNVIGFSDYGAGANGLAGTRTWTFTTVDAPATGFDFDFLVYGDSRAGNICGGNTVHAGLVAQMAVEPASFVIHVGDMIAGLYNTTNWTQRGGCPLDADRGSLAQMIAPLKSKTPAAGLPTFFFPVIGNHDAGWGSGWYPDPYGEGVCSVFDIPALGIQNHTRMSYFQDQTSRVPHYTDAEFYSLACSTTSPAVYDTFMYYTFKFKNSQFVIMRLNDDNHDVMACNTCDGALGNYDHYFYKHQLDWLNYVLTAAQADSGVQNIFVFTHAPLLTRSEHPPVASWPTLLPTFSSYPKVKAVFSGHNHVYERSHPVKATVANPMGSRDDAAGVVYYTTGGGGSPINDFIRTEPLMAVGLAPYHYMRVTVNGNLITTKAIKQDGSVMDQFTR